MHKGYVDLHVHTTYSDGTFTPSEAVRRASALGLSGLGIADHDSTLGIGEAIEAAEDLELEIVPAVELSCTAHDLDIHVLGYFIDYRDAGFLETLAKIRDERFLRAVKMIENLGEMGVRLDVDRVKAVAGMGSVGRPHIAEVLVENGYVRHSSEAFVRYIGYHSPAYVPKMKLSPKAAFDLIKSVGGMTVLAHPGTLGRDDLIIEFMREGLDGIEVWHSKHDRATSRRLTQLAQRYGLLATGGSDCHGERQDGPLIGTVRVPYKILDALKSAGRNIAAV